jgi:transposase
MSQVIMVACDLHAKTMVLKIAQGRSKPETRTLANTPAGRSTLLGLLKERSAATRAEVVFAYEASSLGFGLYDELTAAGIRCHVLAPTKIVRSAQQKRRKTDDKDAELLLELLRAHVLAGNSLPDVWVPDPQTRDDRELVRTRVDVGQKITRIKAQIKGLLKRSYVDVPAGLAKRWTKSYRHWLHDLTREGSPLGCGTRLSLASLLWQLEVHETEERQLNDYVRALALTPRYVKQFYALLQLPGVGPVTAMVYLTELGDMSRFNNRRAIAAYHGLVPSSHETGQCNDRKGHITRQGPSRLRHVLCQAAWVRVRHDENEKAFFARQVTRNPKHKKIALVASMRRLAIRMWHAARDAQAEKQGLPVADRGRDQSPQVPPPGPHPLPSSLCSPRKRAQHQPLVDSSLSESMENKALMTDSQ